MQEPYRNVQPPLGVRKLCLGACVMTDGEFYTSVAESIDPAAAVDFINGYFEVLFRPVFDLGGFVADVKGDGMLAVWDQAEGAADLKRRACLACLRLAEEGERFSRSRGTHPFGTRIGACLGPLALAGLGTAAHQEYRPVGDTVNVSSRLEQLNKELGTRILVCGELAHGMDEFLFRNLGEFQLRGKVKRVRVLELLGLQETAVPAQHRLCADFAAALTDFQRGEIGEAQRRFRTLCSRFPADGPSRFYLKRCEQVMTHRYAGRFLGARAVSVGS